MAEFSSDQSFMLDKKSFISIRAHLDKRMTNNSTYNDQHKKRLNKPHYVFMDFSRGPKPSEASFLVISKANKLISCYIKRSVLIAALFLSFILGFTIGNLLPLCFPPNRIPFLVLSKVSSVVKNKTLNGSIPLNSSYVKDENTLILSRTIDGIYWSDVVEQSLPVGFTNENDRLWKDTVHRAKIVRIEEGCGRMQNRLVTFEDGTKACCRYRQNTDQIQGEIFSYYLGRLLGLKNLVPSTLSLINSTDPLWMQIKGHLESSQWLEGRTVVLTEFLGDLEHALIPPILRNYTRDILDVQNHEIPFQNNNLEVHQKDPEEGKVMDIVGKIRTTEDTIEMAQWSDLIIFDYLTANLDRVVNNLYNLQWNSGMLSSPAHNLARISSSKVLVFLDNESGLLHGYRLLEKYEPYHSLLLDSLCVFRKSTVEALKALRMQSADLNTLLGRQLPSHDALPLLPEKNVDILYQRIERVLLQVEACSQNSSTSL